MKKLFLALATLLMLIEYTNAQTLIELSGRVLDSNANPVVGAIATFKELPQKGSTTDINGRYTIRVPAGRYTLNIKYVGYKTYEKQINLQSKTTLNATIEQSATDIDEIVISRTSTTAKLQNVQIGVEQVDLKSIALAPALFGENDIIKSITLLAGVKSEGDGSSGFQVRGGTSSQNLILLDDAQIYNSGHVLGLFSVFNDDALSSASLYKGQIPAMFGSATSSVLDIQSKNGSMKSTEASFDIGLLSTKASFETPIIEDKLSFFASVRRSYFDLFLKLYDEYSGNKMYFYDINTKLSYRASENNFVSLSYFRGKDMMGLEDMMDMGWSNDALTVKWTHRFNDKLRATTSVVGTDYRSEVGIDVADIYFSFNGYIRSAAIKESFEYKTNEHTLNFGLQSSLVDLLTAEWQFNDFIEREQRTGIESSLWVSDQWKLNQELELSAGLRLNSFLSMGGSPYYTLDQNGDILSVLNYSSDQVVADYLTLEPRLSINWQFNPNQSLKLGYSRSSQNIHAIRSSSSMSMPFDRYAMTSNLIKPEVSDQIALGYIALSADHNYEFTVEGYYKSINNVYDYQDGKLFNSAIELESLVLGGEGRAYGVEFSAKRSMGRLTGWINYTLSWVETQIEGINNGNWYRAANDRRHDLSIIAMYELGRGWQGSANFLFNTGQSLTVPSAKYQVDGDIWYYYSERNNYSTPNYHRLDVSFTHTKQKRNHTREWTFGCYNIYNHYNPYMIYFEENESSTTGSDAIQYSLFGIIPSISYGLKF